MTQIVGDASHIKGKPLSGSLASGETWVFDGTRLVPAANEAYKFISVDGTVLDAKTSADSLVISGVSGVRFIPSSGTGSGAHSIVVQVFGLESGQVPNWSEISGTASLGFGIASGASGVAVEAGVMAAGASGVASGASGMAGGSSGMADYASGKLASADGTSGLVMSSGNGLIAFQSAPSSGSVLKASGTNILTDLYWGVDQTGSGGVSGSGNAYAFITVQGTTLDANAGDDTLHVSGRSGILLSGVSGSGPAQDVIFVQVSGLDSGQIPGWPEISGMASGGSGTAVAASGIAAGASGIAVAGVTPDYRPPAFMYKDADEIYIPTGRYYKAGYRWRGQYQDTQNMYQFWDVSSHLSIDIDATYNSGSSPGMIGGAKVNSSWYSIFLLGNTASDVLVLPFVRIRTVDYNSTNSGKTTVAPAAHDDGTTAENGFIVANDAWNTYRLVKTDSDITDGTMLTIWDTVNATPDQIVIDGDQVSSGAMLAAKDWLQLVPPSGTPCLYLGVVRMDSSGNIFEFARRGWRYTFSLGIGVSGNRTTAFASTDVSAAVPPTAGIAHLTLHADTTSATSFHSVKAELSFGASGNSVLSRSWAGHAGGVQYRQLATNISWQMSEICSIRNRFFGWSDASGGADAGINIGTLLFYGFKE